ncbi:MAG: putative glycolipid-binding domain-containing protein [Pirellulales bacterium]
MRRSESAAWKRLDVDGRDDCVWSPGTLGGTSVGCESDVAFQLECDEHDVFKRATVRGRFRASSIDVHIVRSVSGDWTLNDVLQTGLVDLTDLDFGFTPATNVFQLRRVGDEIGVRRALPVVWWDLDAEMLMRLPQFYTRRSASTVWYESPEHGYEALLEVDPDGFVRRYPELWERV